MGNTLKQEAISNGNDNNLYIPVSEHFEEGVVVEVLPHVVEVVVLAASADALLGVRSLGQL